MGNKNDALRDGGFHVAEKRCDQCLFSDAKVVGDDRRDELLRTCAQKDSYFLCHKSEKPTVCRGFFDTQSNRACRTASQLGLVVFVPTTPKEG